jgi:hypothetical protein
MLRNIPPREKSFLAKGPLHLFNVDVMELLGMAAMIPEDSAKWGVFTVSLCVTHGKCNSEELLSHHKNKGVVVFHMQVWGMTPRVYLGESTIVVVDTLPPVALVDHTEH